VQEKFNVLGELKSLREGVRKQLIDFCRACEKDCLTELDCEVKKAYQAIRD